MKALPLLLLLLLPAHASEIDNLSTHYVPLANSDTAMDAHVQGLLDQAMAETKGCNLAAFGKAAAGKIVSTRFYSGATEREAWKNKGVVRVKREMADSVYADSPLATSIVGRLYGLDPVISLNGVRLGTDKLGHFMDHGHNLFLTYGSQEGAAAKAAKHSVEEEEGAFGWVTTGVKSYADIAANLDGYAFWREVYGRGERPYARCENGRLVRARDFRFSDYATHAWNEAINCNEYDGNNFTLPDILSVHMALEDLGHAPESCDVFYEAKATAQKGRFRNVVEKNVAELERKDKAGRRFSCPIEPGLCRGLRETYRRRYGAAATEKAIHPSCR